METFDDWVSCYCSKVYLVLAGASPHKTVKVE